MRELTRLSLVGAGYHVLDVHDGESAFRIASQHPQPIHLLLTDVVMAGMSGWQLAANLAVSRPELKVLYMSGYTADLIADHGILEAKITLLEKPFTQELLLQKVRKVLDAELSRGATASS